MTRAEAFAIAAEFGHHCVADFNTGTVQVDDWQPAMTVGEFMAFSTGLSERRFRTGEGEPYVISQVLAELRGYAEAYSGRAGTQSAIGWTCASAADAIEGFQELITLREHSDSHEHCDAEIERLSGGLRAILAMDPLTLLGEVDSVLRRAYENGANAAYTQARDIANLILSARIEPLRKAQKS